jgi:hypothetical protein
MTPEERFERIEKTLVDLAAESRTRFAESDIRLTRLERTCEFLADNQAQLTAGLAELRNDLTRLTADVVKLTDAVGSLVKLFERHTRDGHGGDDGRDS